MNPTNRSRCAVVVEVGPAVRLAARDGEQSGWTSSNRGGTVSGANARARRVAAKPARPAAPAFMNPRRLVPILASDRKVRTMTARGGAGATVIAGRAEKPGSMSWVSRAAAVVSAAAFHRASPCRTRIVATTTAIWTRSSRWTRSTTSMFEWWVRELYSTRSCMNWNAGIPTSSNDR